MKVLVTGGAGYIGSHSCKALSKAGHEPIAFDNLVYGHEWAVKWGPFVRGDLADTDHLIQTLKTHQIDAVMHFAAFTYVGESVTKPDRYYGNNFVGSLSLLRAMKETGVSKIVFSSTCATYGNPIRVPIGEDHPQNPINPYGASKLMVERVLQDFRTAYGLRYIALRYFNASGADVDGEIGEDHEPEAHLIPLAIDAALERRPPLTVFGSDYDTKDGTCVRDYIHVTDLADAHVLALQALTRGEAPSPAYNLGNGKGFSVREVIASVERATGKKVPHIMGGRRAGDPPTLIADSTKAFAELKWNPQFADLDTIVKTAARWSLKRPKS